MTENWRDRLSGLWARPEEPVPSVRPITFSAELRSCHPRVTFDATFHFWQQGNDRTALYARRQEITQWADGITARYSVTQAGNAENDINTRHTGVQVRLSVSPQARATAEAILDIDRQATVERLKQQAELERVRYLRENVYSRPDVARSYWLYHHPNQLDGMLAIKFEEIAATFGDVGDSQFTTIAKLIGDFLGKLDDGQRGYLLAQLGKIFISYDRPELAEQLGPS